jgi:hypothetical protein
MSDIANRGELEADFARRLSRLMRGDVGRVLDAVGDPPSLDNVPATLWDEINMSYTREIAPALEKVFLQQARVLLDEIPIGVDWGLINRRAVDWARSYTYDLVRGINNTSREALRSAGSAYFERGQTRAELEAALSRIYSPVRSEMIAVTEITRAASAGEIAVDEELRRDGIEMSVVWQTSNDELVCPLCSPLNGKPRGIDWSEPPPRHPRCRCWINHVLPEVTNG